MSTIAEALQRASEQLQATSDSPELDARVLLGFVLGKTTVELLSHPDAALTTDQKKQFMSLVQRRQTGQPVAYLIGHQEFFGMQIEVTPDVLIPRPATELLVEAVLKNLPVDTAITIADVGCGSGAISLALARHLPQASLIASDVSIPALQIAKRNARRLGLSKQITFLQSSLLEAFDKFPDIIIANLPYLTHEQLSEPSIKKEPTLALAGGRDGLMIIDQLVSSLPNLPSYGLFLEFDPNQTTSVISQIRRRWPKAEIKEINDGLACRGLSVLPS